MIASQFSSPGLSDCLDNDAICRIKESFAQATLEVPSGIYHYIFLVVL